MRNNPATNSPCRSSETNEDRNSMRLVSCRLYNRTGGGGGGGGGGGDDAHVAAAAAAAAAVVLVQCY